VWVCGHLPAVTQTVSAKRIGLLVSRARPASRLNCPHLRKLAIAPTGIRLAMTISLLRDAPERPPSFPALLDGGYDVVQYALRFAQDWYPLPAL